jgi:hypothetical protein
MRQILIVIEDETLKKLKANAALETRSTSNYLGHLIDNLFKDTEIIKTNEISCKKSNIVDNANTTNNIDSSEWDEDIFKDE